MTEYGTDEGGDAIRIDERRHALWGLTVLVLVAIVVIAVTLLLVGSPGASDDRGDRGDKLAVPTQQVQPTSPVGTPTGADTTASTSAVTTPATRTEPPKTRHSGHTSPAGSSTAGTRAGAPPTYPRTSATHSSAPSRPCSGSSACTVRGDGGVTAALNAARQADGAPPAKITVTASAQACAAQGGGNCGAQYALQIEPAQDGQAAIADLLAGSGNDWLLDAQGKQLQIGWAYNPQLSSYLVALVQVS